METQISDFTPVQFSTDDLHEHDSGSIWREAFARRVLKLDIRPLNDEPLGCRTILRVLPGLALVETITTAGINIERDKELIAADGNDNVGLNLLLKGKAYTSQFGREHAAKDGDVIFITNAEPCTMHLPCGVHFLSLQMRRTALAPFVANLNDAILRPIPPKIETLQYLIGYVRFLQEAPTLSDPDIARTTATHICDLVALALGSVEERAHLAKQRGLRAARMTAIKKFIATNSSDYGLTLEAVAARHRLTPRYVQRLFESDGLTFTKFLLNQRLSRARGMLADPCYAKWSVSAIAFRVGFSDVSYFNRCFRRFYGATPSDIRAQAYQEIHG